MDAVTSTVVVFFAAFFGQLAVITISDGGRVKDGDVGDRGTLCSNFLSGAIWRSYASQGMKTMEEHQGEERVGLREAWARRRYRIAERRRVWELVEPYRRPPRLMPLLLLNALAFYTGVVGAAITEQVYKENYWDEHPGAAVPIMHPMFYWGPYRVTREDFSGEDSG